MDKTASVTPFSQNVNGPNGIFQTKSLQLHVVQSFRWDPGSSNKGNKRQRTDKTLSTGVYALVLNAREELFTWRYMQRLRKTHRTMCPAGVKCITKGGEQLDSLSKAGWTSRSTGASRKHLTRISIGTIPALQERQSCPTVGRKKRRVSSLSNAETIVLLFCLITDKAALRRPPRTLIAVRWQSS